MGDTLKFWLDWGVQFLVAAGTIGAVAVAHSAPDGYTLLMGTNTTQASNVAMMKDLPYDPIKDFSPIIRTTTTATVLLVKPDFPAKNLAEFLSYARAHPNLTAGYGSGASQICIGQLRSRGGLTVIAASYRGVPQAVTDVMAGAINLTFADLSLSIPQIKGGTLRGIGVSSPKRNELAPDLPALAEAMPGFEATIWYGLLAPAKTPDAIVDKLYAESEKFLSLPATREKLADVGVIVATMPPKEFGSFIASEIVRWTADAKAAGIEPQ
jgi:tripartite-type tricarboxylate transporter receptor subunit TctC